LKITVIGSGYVGTTTALVLAKLGHDVIGYDVNDGKVEKLNQGILPFREPGLDDLLQELLQDERIRFTSDSRTAITQSEILMISVGTPSTAKGNADLTFLRQVLETISEHINGPKIVVTKSTVPVGTNRWIKQVLDQKVDTLPFAVEVISNPEFLREGEALRDSLSPSRTVIGGADPDAIEKVKLLYAKLPTSYFTCNWETAEMIKYASNGFLAAKISFINEIARLADRVGADIQGVAAGMGMDPRISPHHLYAGIGYGGSCFPKDVDELLFLAREHKVHMGLLKQAKRVNDSQIGWFVQKVESVLPLQGKRVLVLGMAFKEDTDDQRESPGIRLTEQLLDRGVGEVRVMDPTIDALEQIRWSKPFDERNKERVRVVTDVKKAGTGVHAVLLATPWQQFRSIPWQEWAETCEAAYVFDGRNFLDPDVMRRCGWHYFGVARGDPAK
jgi:UDPglucose 6-dehydrogenase